MDIKKVVQTTLERVKTYIDNNYNNVNNKVGELNSLNTSTKNDIVSAVNEVVELSNDAKVSIADAIGEPLNPNDTFSNMSNDINNLLSTFKTNMMKNGVTANSGDKFKALIDKIATLADNEGGLQYVTGNATANGDVSYDFLSSDGTENGAIYIDLSNLGFTPMFVIVTYNNSPTSMSVYIDKSFGFYFSNYMNVKGKSFTILSYSDGSSGPMWHSDNNNLKIAATATGVHTYHAIGVGKEDTTLRDSLASILEGEGVIVTEEDDMASLITKVDEEFDRKNANSGLDIISATELPATGKENQICVITDNPVDNFRISNLQTDILNDGNIYLKLGSGSGPSSGNITLGDTVQTIYHVDGIYQNDTKLKSYVYQDGNWIEFTKIGIDIMINGSYTIDSETYGTFKERSSTSSSKITFTDGNGLWMNHGLVSSGRSGYMHTYLTKKIDISGFTKVKITLKDMDYGGTASSNMLATLHFCKTVPTASLLTDPDEDDDYPSKSQSIGRVDFTSKEIVYNISDMTGSYYLDFEIYTPSDSSGYYVDVRLTDFSIE